VVILRRKPGAVFPVVLKVMTGYIHPRSIQGPYKGDRHSFPIEMLYALGK
jgi:hypothetical protein